MSPVVPCLNEERNLPYVFGRMPADIDEVVLVVGGSVDGTGSGIWSSIGHDVIAQARPVAMPALKGGDEG